MNKSQIEAAAGCKVEITKILERDTTRERDITVVPEQFTQDPDSIFKDPEIDIVIELLGGIEPAYTFVKRSLMAGKSVATSNKALAFIKALPCSKSTVTACTLSILLKHSFTLLAQCLQCIPSIAN